MAHEGEVVGRVYPREGRVASLEKGGPRRCTRGCQADASQWMKEGSTQYSGAVHRQPRNDGDLPHQEGCKACYASSAPTIGYLSVEDGEFIVITYWQGADEVESDRSHRTRTWRSIRRGVPPNEDVQSNGNRSAPFQFIAVHSRTLQMTRW